MTNQSNCRKKLSNCLNLYLDFQFLKLEPIEYFFIVYFEVLMLNKNLLI